jgi:hypothetical protein
VATLGSTIYYAALMNWTVRSDDGKQAMLDIGDWGGLVLRGGYQAPPAPPATAAPPAGGRGGGPRAPRNAAFDGFCWGIDAWDAKTVEAELKKRGLAPVADKQIAALVMDARQAVADELLGDERQAIAIALRPLIRGEGLALADALERASRAIRHATAQVAEIVLVERPARRVRRGLRDARQLERLAVVVRRVAAAMLDDDRMFLRHLVEVVHEATFGSDPLDPASVPHINNLPSGEVDARPFSVVNSAGARSGLPARRTHCR